MTPLDPLTAFARTWTATVLRTPPLIAPARQYTYPQNVPGEEDALQRGALLVEIRPGSGGVLLATCALGFRDPTLPSGVWSCPTPDTLLAVAGGYSYWVDTRTPERVQLLEQRPTTAIHPVPEHGLLLLAGFHDVLALGPEGVRWRSGRLSWEGVTLGAVEGYTVRGTGWDMFTDAEVSFALNLETGVHEGGGYRVPTGSPAPSTR